MSVFRHRDFRRYFLSRFFATFALQVVSVAVGWQVYDLTGDALALGLIGLVQFLPALCLFLVTGAVADRYSRRLIVGVCAIVGMACALSLVVLAVPGWFMLWVTYAVLLIFGVMRAFLNPALQSLAPNLVPSEDLASAIAWTSSSTKTAQIVGPVAGGLLYALGAYMPYSVAAAFFAFASLMVFAIAKPAPRVNSSAPNWSSITAGFRYILSERILLGAISLDLFAVLLGGAVALMPIFARDVLDLGPSALGLLRGAPAIGAIATAVILAMHPIQAHAGLWMYAGVVIFGLMTILFGLSTAPWLSIAALVVMGAADMISVYVRSSLIALWTPDELRGRVNAVNQVFIGASNELGAFRAGSMAAAIGAVPAVLVGGIGTFVVAVSWMCLFPKLRRVSSLAAQVR